MFSFRNRLGKPCKLKAALCVDSARHISYFVAVFKIIIKTEMYEGWNFNSGNYLFTTDTK